MGAVHSDNYLLCQSLKRSLVKKKITGLIMKPDHDAQPDLNLDC